MLCWGSTGILFAQIARRRPSDKGPRALALVEVAKNGKAHLRPITIMIDGKFYDGGAYKADPIPMALQAETVYEAVKAGVPQGLFTVSGTLHEENGWVADGKWRSTAQIEADKARAKAEAEKKAQKAPSPEQEIGGPPKLRRAPDTAPSSSSPPPTQPTAAPMPQSSPSSKDSGDASASTKSKSDSSAFPDDPNRPVLRRQPPSESIHEQTKADSKPEPLKGPLDFIPAISDADGPDPRPYTYPMKPDEEENFRKKMLAMAGEEINARAAQLSPEVGTASKSARKTTRPAPEPQFENVQLRVFDLSTTNEPVLVLTATAKVSAAHTDVEYMTALVARVDIYNDLHKAFAQTTDSQHLDALPKYELVDAVDVDGDGRGELLFRTTWDYGSAFSVYRVIGDRLWPLFEGKPGT